MNRLSLRAILSQRILGCGRFGLNADLHRGRIGRALDLAVTNYRDLAHTRHARACLRRNRPRVEQANQAGHSLDDELHLLTVHGILHLLGYDHAEPAEERKMFQLQNELLDEWRDQRERDAHRARLAAVDSAVLDVVAIDLGHNAAGGAAKGSDVAPGAADEARSDVDPGPRIGGV